MWMHSIFSIGLATLGIVVSTVSAFVLGLTLYSFIYLFVQQRKVSLRSLSPLIMCYSFLLGLSLNTSLQFALLSLGVPWATVLVLTHVAPLALLLLPAVPKLALPKLRPPSLNFTLWLILVTTIGVTLVDYREGAISSLWRNTYGDYAFHLGMISYFLDYNSFPAYYQIFAGQELSYPFFINLWSAALWYPVQASFGFLKVVFVFQWVVLWLVIFFAARGQRNVWVPWAILLGGGSFFALGDNSGSLISHGYPWTSFLSTIWIPQRSSVLGCAIVMISARIALPLVLNGGEPAYRGHLRAILVGLFLSFSLLTHSHFILLTIAALGTLIVCKDLTTWFTHGGRQRAYFTLSFAAASLPVLLFLPMILGKSSMISYSIGWMGESLDTWGWWLTQAPGWIIAFGLLALGGRQRWIYVAVLLAFLLILQLVHLSVWNWDQIKPLLAIYLLTLAGFSVIPLKSRITQAILALLLCSASAFEVGSNFIKRQDTEIFSAQSVLEAREIRAVTSPHSILISAPIHNTSAALSGRQLYYGYEGHLSSHAIPYLERQKEVASLEESFCINANRGAEALPTHAVWGESERRHWGTDAPPACFEATESRIIYMLK